MAEVRRRLAAAMPLLVVVLAVVWLCPVALGDDALVWHQTEWRFHPPEGFASSGYDRQAFSPLANGWVAVLGQLRSTYDGFVQLHDEGGRWLWTQPLRGDDGIVGYWSRPAALAVRSRSGAWNVVAVDGQGDYVWRLDSQGELLWRRRLAKDMGLEFAPAAAAEGSTVWLGGWAGTDDMCGEGAAVVKLDEAGNVVWRWRRPKPSFAAVNDLLPLGDGRLLVLVDYGGPLAYLGNMSAVCPRTAESELVLLDAEGTEVARRMLPLDPGIEAMVRLADGRVALPVDRNQVNDTNRLFIVALDARDGISVEEVSLDLLLLNASMFSLLPAGADSDGSLIFYNGRALRWVLSDGRIARTQELPTYDLWRCEFKASPGLVCLGYYTLKSLDLP